MDEEANKSSDRFWPTLNYQPYWYWVLGFCLLALALCPFDIAIANATKANNLPGDVVRVFSLSEFFAHGFGIAVILTAVWLLAPGDRRYLPRLAICAFFPGMIVQGIKVLFGRRRPLHFRDEFPESIWESWVGLLPNGEFNIEHVTQAFPSGHTATAVGLAVGLAWLYPRGRVLFLGAASLAATQRVVFQAHWCSDVMVGFAVGIMVGNAMTLNWGFGYWCSLWEKRSERSEQLLKIAEFDETKPSRKAA